MEKEREEDSSLVLFRHSPHCENSTFMASSKPNYLLKAPPPDTTALRVRVSPYEFWRRPHIVYNTKKSQMQLLLLHHCVFNKGGGCIFDMLVIILCRAFKNQSAKTCKYSTVAMATGGRHLFYWEPGGGGFTVNGERFPIIDQPSLLLSSSQAFRFLSSPTETPPANH